MEITAVAFLPQSSGTKILLNLIWFGWRYMAYSGFSEGMTRIDMSSPVFPTYAAKDEDGSDYTVKDPDDLSLTGNKCG